MIGRLYILGLLLLGVGLGIASLKRNRELRARSVTLLVLLSLFCLIMWAGSLSFTLLIMVILLAGVYELGTQYDLPILPALVGAGGLFVALAYFSNVLLYILPVFVVLSISAFTLKAENVRQNAFFALFAFGFLVPCAASLSALYRLRSESILVLLVLLQCNDVFGYLFGKKFGRRKIFKHLSPGKSLEGYLFSLFGILVGIGILQTIIPVLRGSSLLQQGILLLYFFVFANLGDLLFSSIKRKLGLKDFSSLLPGHGGVLDRFDSFLFTAPGLYVLILYGVL